MHCYGLQGGLMPLGAGWRANLAPVIMWPSENGLRRNEMQTRRDGDAPSPIPGSCPCIITDYNLKLWSLAEQLTCARRRLFASGCDKCSGGCASVAHIVPAFWGLCMGHGKLVVYPYGGLLDTPLDILYIFCYICLSAHVLGDMCAVQWLDTTRPTFSFPVSILKTLMYVCQSEHWRLKLKLTEASRVICGRSRSCQLIDATEDTDRSPWTNVHLHPFTLCLYIPNNQSWKDISTVTSGSINDVLTLGSGRQYRYEGSTFLTPCGANRAINYIYYPVGTWHSFT